MGVATLSIMGVGALITGGEVWLQPIPKSQETAGDPGRACRVKSGDGIGARRAVPRSPGSFTRLAVTKDGCEARAIRFTFGVVGLVACILAGCSDQGWPDTDKLLVEFQADVDRTTMDAIHAEIDATVVSSSRLTNFDAVRLPADVSVEQGIRFYESHREVLYAIPNLELNQPSDAPMLDGSL